MKKIFLSLTLLLSLNSFAQSNIYHPFPEGNTYWNIYRSSGCDFSFVGSQEYYTITMGADTIINLTSYHRLMVPKVKVVNSSACNNAGTFYYNGYYAGAIRQDSIAKKVYIVNPNSVVEELLYDFNLQVGDSVNTYLNMMGTDTVQAIDSVLVNNSYHKRWLLNSCYNAYLIEGVGCTYGMLQAIPGCVADLPAYNLDCVNQNNTTIYNSLIGNCEIITQLDEFKRGDKRLKIEQQGNTITLHSEFEITYLQITDYTGRIIKNENVNNATYTFHVDFQEGYYMLKSIDKYGRSEATPIFIKK